MLGEDDSYSRKRSGRDELRLKMLCALEANLGIAQRQLAAVLGVSLGGGNYALKSFIELGFVRATTSESLEGKVPTCAC